MEKYGVKQDLSEEEEKTFRKLANDNKTKEGSDGTKPERRGNVLFDPDEGTKPFEQESSNVDSGASGDKERDDT